MDLEEIFTVGHNTFESVNNSFGVTFEDDLSIGHFYANAPGYELQILCTFHIYNVADIIDKDKACKLQIAWTEDD